MNMLERGIRFLELPRHFIYFRSHYFIEAKERYFTIMPFKFSSAV